jgi:hypothetical protein
VRTCSVFCREPPRCIVLIARPALSNFWSNRVGAGALILALALAAWLLVYGAYLLLDWIF